MTNFFQDDLRAASALLYRRETSSVISDSLEDLSVRLGDISNIGPSEDTTGDRYEKDIREIVEYFEQNCQVKQSKKTTCPSLADNTRSKKIESLILKVAEKQSRARHGKHGGQVQQHLQVCDGIVRSKLPLFDQAQESGGARRKKAVITNNNNTILDNLAHDHVEIVDRKCD